MIVKGSRVHHRVPSPTHLGAHGIDTCCWSNVECNTLDAPAQSKRECGKSTNCDKGAAHDERRKDVMAELDCDTAGDSIEKSMCPRCKVVQKVQNTCNGQRGRLRCNLQQRGVEQWHSHKQLAHAVGTTAEQPTLRHSRERFAPFTKSAPHRGWCSATGQEHFRSFFRGTPTISLVSSKLAK